MNKIYEEYKIINVNEIEGARAPAKDRRIKDAIKNEKKILRCLPIKCYDWWPRCITPNGVLYGKIRI